MKARIENPADHLGAAVKGIQTLVGHAYSAGVPAEVLHLVHLRASQINGCSYCVDSGAKHGRQAGISDERLFGVAAWGEAPFFSDAERAALALTEAMTRLGDRADPVSDEIWAAAAEHYGERELSALVLWIATVNLFNRFNVATRQVAGASVW